VRTPHPDHSSSPIRWSTTASMRAAGTIPLSIALALLMAVWVNGRIPGRSLLRLSFFTPTVLPMIALGVPGSPTAAVLLGGLLIWGLQPGPLLFVEQKDFVWGLIASMYTGNVIGVAMVLAFVPFFAAILRIPFAIIAPVIVVICAIGAYTVHNSMFDVWMMVVFGVVGYLFKKLKYPLAPLVLALVLGDMAETAFRQSMLLSKGRVGIFWSNPLVTTYLKRVRRVP